jgi:hypothetical protein
MSEMGFPKVVVPAAISCSVCCSAVGFVYQVCLNFLKVCPTLFISCNVAFIECVWSLCCLFGRQKSLIVFMYQVVACVLLRCTPTGNALKSRS